MRSSHERIFWEFGHVFLLVDKREREKYWMRDQFSVHDPLDLIAHHET